MLKRLVLATALLAGSAWAQQEISLTAKDLETGAADAKLAELGRQAAAGGKDVVINAPKEWHGAVAAKVKAGGATSVKLNDSFFENVVVRVADKPKAEPPKPAEAPKPAAAPAPAPAKPVEAPKPAAPAKPIEAPRPATPPPAPAPAPTPPPVETAPPPAPAPAPVVETPPPPPAKPVEAPKPAVDASAAIKQRFEKNLNGGKPAKGDLVQTALRKGDILYLDGDVRAVVRRDSLGTSLYWLTEEINLQRAELKPLADNRYEVVNTISAGNEVSLRGTVSGEAQVFQSAVPADGAAERAEMEKLYAEGRPVGRSLRADQLRQGDMLYLGKSSAIIVRRDSGSLARYWLDGPLNTNQVGLQKEKGTGGKFKVLSDNIQ